MSNITSAATTGLPETLPRRSFLAGLLALPIATTLGSAMPIGEANAGVAVGEAPEFLALARAAEEAADACSAAHRRRIEAVAHFERIAPECPDCLHPKDKEWAVLPRIRIATIEGKEPEREIWGDRTAYRFIAEGLREVIGRRNPAWKAARALARKKLPIVERYEAAWEVADALSGATAAIEAHKAAMTAAESAVTALLDAQAMTFQGFVIKAQRLAGLDDCIGYSAVIAALCRGGGRTFVNELAEMSREVPPSSRPIRAGDTTGKNS